MYQGARSGKSVVRRGAVSVRVGARGGQLRRVLVFGSMSVLFSLGALAVPSTARAVAPTYYAGGTGLYGWPYYIGGSPEQVCEQIRDAWVSYFGNAGISLSASVVTTSPYPNVPTGDLFCHISGGGGYMQVNQMYSEISGACAYPGSRNDPSAYTTNCLLPSDAPDPHVNVATPRTYCGVGDPIDPASGNILEFDTDYVGAGPFPLRFVRYYNSQGLLGTSLGGRWTHTYERRILLLNPASEIAAVREDGKTVTFVPGTGAAWVARDAYVSDTLAVVTDTPGVAWQLYVSGGDETEAYDSNGRLVSITARSGLAQKLVYNVNGQLISVQDPAGRSLTFAWGTNRRISSVTDPAGQTYNFGYQQRVSSPFSPAPDLTSVTYPDTTTRTYVYYESANLPASFDHALTGVIDENGIRYATFTYDNARRAISTQLAGGNYNYSLTFNTGSTVVTEPLQQGTGSSRTYSFQIVSGEYRNTTVSSACSACSMAAAQSFDTNGNVASRTDFNGNRTTYGYDLTRNLETQRVEGLTSGGAASAATRTISTQWHASFRLPTKIAEPKRITTYTYDAPGTLTSKSIQVTTDTSGASGFSATPTGPARTWSYLNTYSSTTPGLLIQQVMDGPRTDVTDTTTSVWDSSGNLSSVTNALGHATTLTNYDPHGRPQQITDPNGLVTTLSYDQRGRLTSRDMGGELTGYLYDSVGQLTQVTLPDGSYLTYSYDAAHRLTQIQDSLGNKIAYTLDAMGNRVQEQVTDSNSTLTQTRSRVYNSLNRLVQDIGAASQSTNYAYDNQGNLTSIADPLNHSSTQAFDALNRLVRMVDPNGGQTQYAYDGLDQLIQVSDPRQLATSYTLDGLGNLTQLTSPDSGTTLRGFDEGGNLISQTDARLVSASFSYDVLNRLVRATYTAPTGSGIAPVAIAYSYDQGANGLGRLSSVSEPSGTTTYSYDLHGRLTQETRVIATVAYLTGYRYDSFGRRNQMIYPSGRSVDYSFDTLGRVQQVDTTYQGVTQPVVIQVAYQPFGPIKSFAFGNASGSVRSFDLDGRIASYTLGSITRSVAYDDASRITGFTHANASFDQHFGYDTLNRLTGWSTAVTNQGFSYDPVGNRTSQSIGATSYPYTYLALSNQLTSVAGPTPTGYQYDAAGSLQLGNQASFNYDARHRLIQTRFGSQGASYQVNALGQRVLKTPTSGSATVYHYDSSGGLIGESDTQGNVQVEYLHLGDMPIAVIQ